MNVSLPACPQIKSSESGEALDQPAPEDSSAQQQSAEVGARMFGPVVEWLGGCLGDGVSK